jgi:hypothetical protein
MNGQVWSWRNLGLYVPVVLCSYGLAGATTDAITGTQRNAGFLARAGLWVLAGWWVTLVFLPAALLLLALASRLPSRWTVTRRRVTLLLVAPLLFATAMGVAALAAAGNADVLSSAYVAVVAVPALAYATVVRIPQ